MIAGIFERWVTRRESPHTQRTYRQDVMTLVKFLDLRWPEDARQLVTVTAADVQAWREAMIENQAAPKTINRRIFSTSNFYKFLGAAAAELRLPISIPPTHTQFIARTGTDPQDMHALTATRARRLMGRPRGDDLFDHRDRVILRFHLYSGPA